MIKKRISIYLVLVVLCLIFTGCGSAPVSNESKPKEDEKIQIGMIFDSFVIERWQRDRDVFVSMAKELGAEVNVQNANGDIQEQKKQIEYFIKKNVDAIVIIPIDAEELKDSVQKAKDAGIKIIAYDRLIKDANVDLYISFDNAMVGKIMAQSLIDYGIGDGSVLMVGGATSDNNVILLEEGFREVMKNNNVEIKDSFHAEGWRAELAAEYVYEHMELVSQVDAIMCGNDNLASSVVPALAEKRMAGNKIVIGQDADLEACQRIVEGTQLMTVYKPVEKLARRAAECTIALVKGETIRGGDTSVINDGTYYVPYVALQSLKVDKDNINEVIIGNGFHLKEDVYLNVPNKMPK